MINYDIALSAERAVVGALLIDANEASNLISTLRSDDFTDENSRIIFVAANDILNRGSGIDALIIQKECADKGHRFSNSQLMDMMAACPTFENLKAYVSTIKEYSVQRQLGTILNDIQESEGTASELILKAQDKMEQLLKFSGSGDGLPDGELLSAYNDEIPQRNEELIEGILRVGHKMIISSASKAGKSFLSMELAIAIAEGDRWLGRQCKKGKVLYVNMEIDKNSCINRFADIYKALYGYDVKMSEDIILLTLRGFSRPLNELRKPIVNRIKAYGCDCVILDPIYKLLMGDENSAKDMGDLCGEMDKICSESGASCIFIHHHSKGSQGSKLAQDRASGSGVLARDPDAIVDIINLNVDPDRVPENLRQYEAFRLTASLREFRSIDGIDFWFTHPIHRIDTEGILSQFYASGDGRANLALSPKRLSDEDRQSKIDIAYIQLKDILNEDLISVKDIASQAGISYRSVINWFNDDIIEGYEMKKMGSSNFIKPL